MTCATHQGLISEFIKTAANRKVPTERRSLPPLLAKAKILLVNEPLGAEVCYFTDKTVRLYGAFDDLG